MQPTCSYVQQLTSRAEFLEQKDRTVEIQKLRAAFNGDFCQNVLYITLISVSWAKWSFVQFLEYYGRKKKGQCQVLLAI